MCAMHTYILQRKIKYYLYIFMWVFKRYSEYIYIYNLYIRNKFCNVLKLDMCLTMNNYILNIICNRASYFYRKKYFFYLD